MAQILVIASGKGGVGKSTLTAGLSCALVGMGKRVLAADFDIGLRGLDLMLGAGDRVVFDWGDVLTGRCALAQALLETRGSPCWPPPRVGMTRSRPKRFAR
jgi:septum site-determining protein MinD